MQRGINNGIIVSTLFSYNGVSNYDFFYSRINHIEFSYKLFPFSIQMIQLFDYLDQINFKKKI